MSEVAARVDGGLRKVRSGLVAALLFAGALVCLVALPLSMGWKWPPGPPDGVRVFEWGLSLFLIVAALGTSRNSNQLWMRAVCAFVLVVCSFANATAVIFEAWNDVDDPLPGLLILVAVLAVGGGICRQRIIGLGAVAAFVVIMGSALAPGRRAATIEKDGIRAMLASLGRDGSSKWASIHPTFSSTSGAPMDRIADMWVVQVSSTAGFLLPVHCQNMVTPVGFVHAMSLSPYVPSWVASENFVLTVQKWPSSPLVWARVPLHVVPSRPVQVRQGKAWIDVAPLRRSEMTNSSPPEPCLATQLSFGGPGIRDYGRGELRVIDDQGRLVETHPGSGAENGDNAGLRLELSDVQRGVKWLDFYVYSPAQLDANRVTFNFDHMATR